MFFLADLLNVSTSKVIDMFPCPAIDSSMTWLGEDSVVNPKM
jgi:hypothetical protein